MKRFPVLLLLLAALGGCEPDYKPKLPGGVTPSGPAARVETAVFAGGCFWCTEADFEKVPGVLSARSGYTGGTAANPNYEQVSAGGTGHYEAVQIRYDSRRVGYAALVGYYFRTVDPTDAGGQFCDRGESYRTAVFVANAEQRRAAEAAKKKAQEEIGAPVVTPILDAGPFYPAEDYHQDYHKKNKLRYRFYRGRCGRDARLQEVWGRGGA